MRLCRTSTRKTEASFQAFEQQRGAGGENQIHQRHCAIDRKGAVGGCHHQLTLAKEFIKSDHRGQAGVFDQGDELVGERRQHPSHRLGCNQILHPRDRAEAQRIRSLPLPSIDRFNSAAQNLGQVGGSIHAESGHCCRKPWDAPAHPHGLQQSGQTEVNQKQLHQHGGAAEKVDIHLATEPSDGPGRLQQHG